jgi:mRNA interferase RelE/StbE
MTMPGNKYIIKYFDSVIKEDIPTLPNPVKTMIKKAIEERLIIDPIGFGKPLRYSLKGHRRLCVSDIELYIELIQITILLLLLPLNIVKMYTMNFHKNLPIKKNQRFF